MTIGQKDKYNGAKMEEFQRDHALYMAFAPADNPQIALAVIVENAGWGAGVAAPIARRVFDLALLGQYPSEEDMLAVQKGLAAAPTGKPRMAADMVGALVPGAGGDMSAGALAPAALGAQAAVSAAHPASAPKAGDIKAIQAVKAVKAAGAVGPTRTGKKAAAEARADAPQASAAPLATLRANPD